MLFIYHMICTSYLFVFVRGPAYGYKGKVLPPFEENGSSKIGVIFDRSVQEGNDLGGLCEEDHGFLCSGNYRTCIYWLLWNVF